MADLTDYGETKVQKMEVDYSTTVDAKIPECEALAKVLLKTFFLLINLIFGHLCNIAESFSHFQSRLLKIYSIIQVV